MRENLLVVVFQILQLTFYVVADSSILCNKSDHVNGSWVHSEGREKAWHCFDHFGTKSHQGERLEYFSGIPKYGAESYYGCSCDRKLETALRPSPREQWKWVQNDCQLQSFDAAKFCKVLGTKQVLFAGDSTMWQSAATVMSLVANLGCVSQLHFGSAKRLVVVNEAEHNYHLKDAINKFNPDVVVMTAGPHFHSVEEYQAFLHAFGTWMEESKGTNNKKIEYFWKTINPGHVNCQHAYEPTAYNSSAFTSETDEYAWGLHPLFDELAKQKMRELGIAVLDMSPLYARADSHLASAGMNINGDCLHYCLPGPIDIFATLLYQQLLNNEEK